ncbi:SrtB family sortase [Bacillus sp. 7586-K]|nr:SrtB family sortase [Bacillus sp. 7586-K]
MKSKRKKSKTSSLQRVITIIFLGLFVFSGYKLLSIFYDYYENRKVLAEIQEVYVPIKETKESRDDGEIRTQFQDLLHINSDIVGWITIDDTSIHYPILQTSNNMDYLQKNYKREETRAGSIFMDYRNSIQEVERHTILYGHRMKDGSMFGQLDKFLNQEFVNEHHQFYFDTLYKGYDVEVFSAYVTTTDFYYIETDFSSDTDYLQFLETIKQQSVVKTNTKLNANDQIITLSTCDYGLDRHKGRLVVHGKLVKRSS